MATPKKEKYRYFVFIVYEESAAEDWRERLKKSHGCFAISPLHQPDEECKKPHYHVVYMHGNTTTLEGAKRAIPKDVAANNYVEPCPHPRNYQRYLVHMDDPEKQQWEGNPRELIEVVNNFPLDLSRDYSKEERYQQRMDVIALIRDNDLCEYADLLEGLIDNGLYDLFDYASNHTIMMQAYLGSRRNRGRKPSEEQDETPDE